MSSNRIGETVGVFIIVELMSKKDKDGHSLYRGICNKCGVERIARYHDLKRTNECTHIGIDGRISSQKIKWDNNRIKGIFHGMKQRCYNDKDESYKWYGAKNIKIYDEWLKNPKSFEEWALQNGYKDNLTIDRINENKDYTPDNCRWITSVNNTKYKSTTSVIDIDGEVHTGRDWSKILGFGENRINTYVRKYGIENTIIFIKKYLKNPNLIPKANQSYYDLYMNNISTMAV